MKDSYYKFLFDEYRKLDKSILIPKDDIEFKKHFDKWNFFDYTKTLVNSYGYTKDDAILSPGNIFLYEEFDGSSKRIVRYPKIGIYLNSLPCDQTVEVEWSNVRRTWEYNRECHYKDIGEEYSCQYIDFRTQVQSLPIWYDYLLIYGVWDKIPNWKELRKHYDRTWWFHKTIEQKRDITLNKLING